MKEETQTKASTVSTKSPERRDTHYCGPISMAVGCIGCLCFPFNLFILQYPLDPKEVKVEVAKEAVAKPTAKAQLTPPRPAHLPRMYPYAHPGHPAQHMVAQPSNRPSYLPYQDTAYTPGHYAPYYPPYDASYIARYERLPAWRPA